MSNVVIKAEHLSKMYRLGTINNGTLWRDIQTWMAIKSGKSDPHSKIGRTNFTDNTDTFWALKDIDFEIQQGDRVGIIGKNGAGKSTLLKILSRVTSPTIGTIKIKGKIASLLEVGTGFHGELTGRENIYLNGAILGMKSKQIDKKLDEIISFSGIDHHIDTPVKRYSSGMYVRLAFAVAAHLDSEILIADEVLAVGDAEFQKKALGKMRELSTGQGRTVLFVSHQMEAIKKLCNKGMLLDKGLIHDYSSIETIIDAYDDKILSAFRLSESTLDEKSRRNSGCLRFKDARLSKSQYNTQEEIEVSFNVEIHEKVSGLFFLLYIKAESGEILTSLVHELFSGDIGGALCKSFQLKIEGGRLRAGRYPLYLWVGDRAALHQGVAINYDVLDGVLPPIKIVQNESEKSNLLNERLNMGRISVSSKIQES